MKPTRTRDEVRFILQGHTTAEVVTRGYHLMLQESDYSDEFYLIGDYRENLNTLIERTIALTNRHF